MKKIVYFGTSLCLIEELLTSFQLSAVVAEKNRVAPNLITYCSKNKIDLITVNTASEIPVLNADLGISFGFGIIFTPEYLNHSFPIINIHPGSFKTNRGRHPLHWNIFLDEPSVHIVFHLITAKIDAGAVIFELEIPRNKNLNIIALEALVLEIIKSNISHVLNDFNPLNNYPKSETGKYRPKFSARSSVNPSQISSKELHALVNIQIKYGGLKIEDQIFERSYITDELPPSEDWIIVTCQDGINVALLKKI